MSRYLLHFNYSHSLSPAQVSLTQEIRNLTLAKKHERRKPVVSSGDQCLHEMRSRSDVVVVVLLGICLAELLIAAGIWAIA